MKEIWSEMKNGNSNWKSHAGEKEESTAKAEKEKAKKIKDTTTKLLGKGRTT